MAAGTLPVISYSLDSADRISAVSSDWTEFAAANDAPELTPGNVLGKLIHDFVSGDEVRALYRVLFQRVRRSGRPLVFPFRCDSPAARRFMTMHLRAQPDESVDITCLTTRIEAREPVLLISRRTKRSGMPIPLCSSCNAVRIGISQWVEADEAAHKLHWFDRDTQPTVTYTLCDRCMADGLGAVG